MKFKRNPLVKNLKQRVVLQIFYVTEKLIFRYAKSEWLLSPPEACESKMDVRKFSCQNEINICEQHEKGDTAMDENMAKHQIEKYWNQRADTFDEDHCQEDKEKWFQYFRNLMGVSAGQSVLDIGTGTGFLAIMAVELGFEVTGIDFAEQMLEIARKKTKQKNLAIRYLNADLNEMPFVDESFDYIVNSRVLWTLTNPETALKEWKRVLKKGGQILSFVRLTEEMRIYTSEEIYSTEVFEKLQFRSSSGAELMECFRSCGFTKVDLVKLPEIAYDPEVYGDWYVLRAMKEQYEQDRALNAISDFWNHRADTYERDHELTSLKYWKENLEYLVGAERSLKILDLATGTGMIANILGEMGYTDVTGMDISEGMMAIARKHALERNTGVRFVYGNALELPLDESSVDVLINCRLLWTLLEPKMAVKEWIRVVKPGGAVIAIQEMEELNPEEEDQVWRHFLYGKNADPYLEFNYAANTQYLELFKDSGLKDVRLVHMKGCQTLENGRNNWYALVGYKEKMEDE